MRRIDMLFYKYIQVLKCSPMIMMEQECKCGKNEKFLLYKINPEVVWYGFTRNLFVYALVPPGALSRAFHCICFI